MRKIKLTWVLAVLTALTLSQAFAAYHHEGEQDSPRFLAVYVDKAGTKLDHCATCHAGGSYESRPGRMVTLGSCQWCHYSYGYDGSGNIIDTLNQYGMDYLVNGRDEAALGIIESLDSDGDGFTNLAEIQAVRYPGNATDDPTKVPAPSLVYSLAELEAMSQHTQFLLMNTSRSGDFYAEYSGVVLENLLADAGILNSAAGITVFSPDGFSIYHPLESSDDPSVYHVNGVYPQTVYYYDQEADVTLNPADGWCDYSAPSCQGRNHLDTIVNADGLRMILALRRDGVYLEPGVLNEDNSLDGEGPFRVVPPQKTPSPPDQSSRAANQDVVWPYTSDWDHNAGASIRSATIIRVEPLPAGTTDIDTLEAGWDYVDQEKIIIYGSISGPECAFTSLSNDLSATPAVGSTVTFTVNGTSAPATTVYYRFDLVPGYGTDSYDPATDWQTIQDFSTATSCTYTFDQAGGYVVVVWASPIPSIHPDAAAIIGGTVAVGEAGAIVLSGLEMTQTAALQAGDSVSFTAQATNTAGGDTYYRFDLVPNYGSADYDPNTTWSIIQDFSTENVCTYAFTESGSYVVLAWASATPSIPSAPAPMIGGCVKID